MTRASAVALALLAGSCTAMAVEQELITFTNVNSNNLFGDVANETRTHVSTGTFPVGFINVSGQQSRALAPDSWWGEACILITPPSGRPFIVQPQAVAAPVAGAVANTVAVWQSIPIDPIASAAGTWTFTFFETFDDAVATDVIPNVDSTWDSISFSLDDGAATIPALSIPGNLTLGASQTWTNQDSNGTLQVAPTLLTFSVPAGASVRGVVVGGTVTSVTGNTISQAGSLVDDAVIRVVPPGLSIIDPLGAGFLPIGGGARGTASGSIVGQFSQVWPAEGDWQVVLYEAVNTAVTPGVDDLVDNVWNSVTVQLVTGATPPATVADLGTIAANTTITQNIAITAADNTAGNKVKWVKFTLPSAVGAWPNLRALTIDTEGSVTVAGSGTTVPNQERNTFVTMFNAIGNRIGADFTDGSDSLATLSFGTDDRPGAVTTITGGAAGVILNGRDGDNVPAGEYYIGVGVGDTGVAVSPGLFTVVPPTINGTGNIVLNIRLDDPFVPTITTQPVADVAQSVSVNDMGDVGTLTAGTEKVTSLAVDVAAGTTTTAPLNVDWVKFTIAQGTAADPSYYVDMDTAGTSFPTSGTVDANDTDCSIWTNTGVIIARNDDFNGQTLASGLSFGNTTTLRDFPEIGVGVFTGAQGALPAGTYWVALAPYNVIHGMNSLADGSATARTADLTRTDTRFRVTRQAVGTSLAAAGQIQFNVRTNIPKAPTCPNPSNVSGPGQNTVTIDAELTADDIIVFLNRFFANDLLSNVSGPGQDTVTLDSELTADDIIVFLNRFFAGC